jgi:His-Xaa-Ser system protein HxsD
MNISKDGCHLTILLDTNIYSEDVLFKCFYWYTDKYNVTINRHTENLFRVQLEFSPHDESEETSNLVIAKIKRDLIDFKLRDIVTKETKIIRELIVAKAFAFFDSDDNPKSIITDPVGYNPLEI